MNVPLAASLAAQTFLLQPHLHIQLTLAMSAKREIHEEDMLMEDVEWPQEPAPGANKVYSRPPPAGASRKRDHIHGIFNEPEYTVWDVYNNEARKVDTELVNDWKESLNSLLLFVSDTLSLGHIY